MTTQHDERAELLGTLRGIATIIRIGEPERLKVNDYEPILKAAALLEAPVHVEPLTLPFDVEFAAAYLDGVMEVEQPEIQSKWANVRAFLSGIGKDQAS